VAETDLSIGFVSGKVYYYQDPNRLQTAGRVSHPILLVGDLVGRNEIDTGQYDKITAYDYLDDIYLLVRRRAYEETGGYDPNFFLYYEETDWCARVRRAGYKLVYTPKAKVWHKQGMSTGGVKSPTFVYYNARNQIVFMRRNTSLSHFIRYLWYLATSSPRRMLGWVKRGKFNLLSAYIRGIGSGVLWLIKDGRRGSIYISSLETGKSE
jgi:GT2 family glycosyltransferase